MLKPFTAFLASSILGRSKEILSKSPEELKFNPALSPYSNP
jgi:hypothetical protein